MNSPTMDEHEEIFQTRNVLLKGYRDNTLQYGGYLLSLAIVFFAEAQLISHAVSAMNVSSTALTAFLIALMAGTTAAATYCAIIALFWGEMARVAGKVSLPAVGEFQKLTLLKNMEDLYAEQLPNFFHRMKPGETYFLYSLAASAGTFIGCFAVVYLLNSGFV
ncbi:MAG: hypothetical protein JRN52_15400 [Nitrososphaerota archaeon]|nr:hypothetical protein [Nitrososphaerota archaeon]